MRNQIKHLRFTNIFIFMINLLIFVSCQRDIEPQKPHIGSPGTVGTNIRQAITVGPTLTTQASSDITATTATGHGNITNFNDTNGAIQHGVCWSLNPYPTISDTCTNEGATSTLGAFSSRMGSKIWMNQVKIL